MNEQKCVVSFADGAGNYAKALMRQELSMKQVGFDGRWAGFNDYAHIGSPMHKAPKEFNPVPYAFKAHSIRKVMEEGARYILWLDSVVYATKSVEPIFDHIKKHGYLLLDNISYSIGDYTSDACLSKHGMSREEAFNNPMTMACVQGFDVQNPKAKEFIEKYIAAAEDGVSYHGSWTNENLQVSNDMRCMGHRHDQSVASILAAQLKMQIINAQSSYFAYVSHKGIVDIAPSVGLWSSGI